MTFKDYGRPTTKMSEWRVCPDFTDFECNYAGQVRRVDGEPFKPFVIALPNKPSRKYKSLRNHFRGHIHRQVFRAWGPKNPDPTRYNCIDHIDNDPLNNHCDNLRWSNKHLNALNTGNRYKGWTFERSRNKYKSHIKWMGRGSTLGRFDTAEEAHECYMECKKFLEWAYREQICEDILLVYEFRKRYYPPAEKHKKRSESLMKYHIKKLQDKGLLKTIPSVKNPFSVVVRKPPAV